jgi:Toprim-like
MRSDQAKTIPIAKYLEHLDIKPAHSRMGGRELWYQSPIRKGDSTPSFKVDTAINKWFDHGLGRGGNTLDLALEICRGSVSDALRALDRTGLYNPHGYVGRGSGLQSVSSLLDETRRAVEKEKKDSRAFKLVKAVDISHPALLQYLEKRKISLKVARHYLKEIWFEPATGGKQFFALGWPSGEGFEARNALFKGFVGTGKDISTIESPNLTACGVFEGFMDFLSFLTENALLRPPFAAIVLNSSSLKARALPYLTEGGFKEVKLFMDRDTMGDECVAFFQGTLETLQPKDMRSEYSGFKDYNAWAMGK